MEFSNEELVQALQEALSGADKDQPRPDEFTTAWFAEATGEVSHRVALAKLKRIHSETGVIEPAFVLTPSPWGDVTVKGWKYVGGIDNLEDKE